MAFKEKYTAEGKTFNREWNGHRFTDAECDKLIRGEMITITVKDKRHFEALVDVVGKLEQQEYKGYKFLGFKAHKYENNRTDLQELIKKLKRNTSGTVQALVDSLNEQTEIIYTVGFYKWDYVKFFELDNKIYYEVYLQSKLNRNQIYMSFIVQAEDNQILDMTDYYKDKYTAIKNSDFYNDYKIYQKIEEKERLAYIEQCQKAEAIREQQYQQAREEARRRRKTRIRVLPWIPVTINDLSEDLDIEDIVNWFYENTDLTDLNTIKKECLFNYKRISEWSSNSHYAADDRGCYTEYIANVYPGLPEQFISWHGAQYLTSSRIKLASDEEKEIEPDVQYVLERTIHGNG